MGWDCTPLELYPLVFAEEDVQPRIVSTSFMYDGKMTSMNRIEEKTVLSQ